MAQNCRFVLVFHSLIEKRITKFKFKAFKAAATTPSYIKRRVQLACFKLDSEKTTTTKSTAGEKQAQKIEHNVSKEKHTKN